MMVIFEHSLQKVGKESTNARKQKKNIDLFFEKISKFQKIFLKKMPLKLYNNL